MAPCPHKNAGFIFRFLHDLGVLGLNKDGQPVVLLMPVLVVGGKGKEDVIVLRLAEGAPDFSSDADDFIGVGAGANGLTDGIDGGEKFLNHIGADKIYLPSVKMIAFRQESAD